jgi:aminopeptidase N
MLRILKLLFAPLLVVNLEPSHGAPLVEHDIALSLDPAKGTLSATDRLSLPPGPADWTFILHHGLNPQIAGGTGHLERLGGDTELEHFRLTLDKPGALTLRYGGEIRHDLEDVRESMGRAHQWSRGTIDPDGAVLDGQSGWYPQIEGTMQRFTLSVQLPRNWLAISQGAGPDAQDRAPGSRIGWREDQPQEDIYLIAGPFTLYRQATPIAEAQVFLRNPDEALAKPYLDATGKYLALYSALIGPYPYAKFALVENFWETGYGMPSFTLLGPQVIRLPFIIQTSYPHEILHNWWGNGVFVDYASGNWSEGLTAYMADHLLKEQRGEGADYRRDTLRAYADYVRDGEDFPIRAFHSRHSSASQAIGYGKALMVFHMLRRNLGDETFVRGLRRFYRDNRFRVATFDDLRRSFEQESGGNLADFFHQWIDRTGAPSVALTDVVQEPNPEGYRVRGRIEQTQTDAPFPLQVPLVVHLANGGTLERKVPLAEREATFELQVAGKALRVDADPRFDLFRRLVPGESPATLSGVFGGRRGLIVLPADTQADLVAGYHALAAGWVKDSPGWEVVTDSDLETLPEGLPAWLLGWRNRFLPQLFADQNDLKLDPAERLLTLAGKTFVGADLSMVLVRDRGGQSIGWIGTNTAAALPGLARKLPHYGKYSYLLFRGQAPDIQLKGQWPVSDSRLMTWLGRDRPPQPQPMEKPLTAVLETIPPATRADRGSGR